MPTRVEDGVVQVLRTALTKIEEERSTLNRIAEEKRREFEDYVARQYESLDRRREALGNALAALCAEDVVPMAETQSDDGVRLAISDENLETIREYIIARDGSVRQQDVVSDTGLNSGVVSVGLRKLRALGELERGGKERGSQVWKTPAAAALTSNGDTDGNGVAGIMAIKPGIGVSAASRL